MSVKIFFVSLLLLSCVAVKKVDSSEAAIQIAEKKLIEVYGDQILKQKPFSAEIHDNVWVVKGTFHCPEGQLCAGGSAEVKVEKSTGEIISIYHSK